VTTIRIIDLETNNIPYLGQKASPHCPDNYVVMPGWRDDVDGKVGVKHHRYFKSRAEAEDINNPWFNLDGVDIIVAHNAMYELSWFIVRYREQLMPFLARGGRVLCTQQAEYILSDFNWTYPPLDEVAPKHGGTHKVDGVKLLWEQGHLTSQIDPALLAEYLIGPSGDVENTALVFYSQMQQLVARGQWRMFLERCEGMLAFAFCEAHGLYVNQPIAHANHAEQLAELNAIDVEINKLLPVLPETLEFNWGSDFHLSALLFGGSVKYQHRVPRTNAEGEILYEKEDCYLFGDKTYTPISAFANGSEQERILMFESACITEGGVDRYKSGKNKGQIKTHKVETDVPQTKWEDTEYKFPGLIDLTKMPPVLRDKFIGKKPEYAGKRFLVCGTPVYSTSGEVLDALAAHGFDAAKLLARRAQLDKDNGTYYLNTEYNKDGSVKKVKGMLQFVGPDSIIHHNLNTCATVTGRLSASNPNLQNLPRDGTSKVKQMFTSRFGDDGVIIEVDYSALEVVMLAALSGDRGLLDDLIAGTDMHCKRLAAKLGEDYSEVVRKCNDHNDPDHKRYKQMRTDIKAPSFAAQYGASAHGIAFATGVTVEFAEEFLATEARLFPRAIEFRQVIRDAVTETGNLPENLCREFNEESNTWTTYRRGYWQAPGGTRYSFRQFNKWDKETRTYKMDYKDTQIANYWCQGEAGYMMTLSAGRVVRYLLQNNFFTGLALLINNVHDALYLDCHKSVAREVGLQVSALMADAPRYMSEQLGYKIAHVPFPAKAEAGPSMYQKEEIV
jgi:hypothetical protein